MPIIKVPIIHKFGIISHSQRLELQERLLQEAFAKAEERKAHIAKNPFEVTDDFIKKYNAASSSSEKAAMEDAAQKILLRIKRRIGIRDGCNGNHVNIPFGWTELTLLAQCRGQVNQDCLDVLILSLEQAAVGKYQIPALFYLAETVLYWLQTEATQQPYLRAAEIKLLRVGFLVFVRLYYHHMAGQLRMQNEAKSRLMVYLEGFDEHQNLYQPYPDVLLNVKFVSSIGKIVTLDGDMDATTADTILNQNTSSEMLKHPSTKSEDSRGGAVSTEVHDLSPTLWHALDVWRCARHLGGDLKDALQALERCMQNISNENWVDSLLAFHIMADAATENVSCLRVLQRIALGDSQRSSKQTKAPVETNANQNSLLATGSVIGGQDLSDISETTEGLTSTSAGADVSSDEAEPASPRHKRPVAAGPDRSRRATVEAPEDPPPAVETSNDTNVASDRQESAAQGLWGWRWEVAVTFAQNLGLLATHGSTSSVREEALTGRADRGDLMTLTHLAGLRDGPTSDRQDDFAWKVRYAALQSLVTLYNSIDNNDKQREALRSSVFNEIVKVRKLERNSFVLEALKTGEITGHLEKVRSNLVKSQISFISGKVAHALSVLYLPSLPPPVQVHLRPRKSKELPPDRPVVIKKNRNTVREEIQIKTALDKKVPDYKSRTSFDLFRVVENQWRKDLHLMQELEEDERADAIQQEYEEKDAKYSKIAKQKK